MPGFRRVLHPSDFSSASRPAFRKAMDLAKSLRGDLVLVHVLPFVVVPMMMGEGYIPAATFDDLQRTARAVAQRHLTRLVAQAKQAGIRVSTRLVEGEPVDDRIVRTAKAVHADIIVIGTHGRTGVRRFLLGSVAARVVATASCSVLTVRGW
jgi:nucleotide-binding universal stress UspA family protein